MGRENTDDELHGDGGGHYHVISAMLGKLGK